MENLTEGFSAQDGGMARSRVQNWTPEFFERLLDGIRDPVYVLSPSQGFRMCFVNRAACDHWGYPEAKLLQMCIPDWDPEFSLVRCATIWERIKKERRVTFETVHKLSSEALVPVEVTSNYIRFKGNEYIVGFIKNISARRGREEKISELTMNLVRSNKHLEQFANVASHDLREPLSTLSNFVRLLGERYQDRLDEEGNRWLRYIQNSANRMRNMVDALLAFSRVEGVAVKPSEVDCAKLISSILEDLFTPLQEANAVVSYTELPTVVADEMQLGHLFQNLISNAIKFRGSDRPRITIAAERGKIEWIFSVTDNGIGIKKDFFERVFQPFQKGHSSEEYAGSGLGLSICRRIIERHDGRIWFKSDPGSETTFYFTLPFRELEKD